MTIDEFEALERMMASGHASDRTITAVAGAIAESERRRNSLPE
jgi:hypothetical protein